jgi:hypothetical protein
MLTALARKQVEACAFHVRPQRNDTAQFELGSVEYVGSDSARVTCKWTDLDDSGKEKIVPQVWLLRKEPEGWRIAGMEATVFGVQPPLHFDFENIQPALRSWRS